MTRLASPALHLVVDRLVIGTRRLFGWGWAADAAQPVRSVRLHAAGDGWEKTIPAGFGLSRDDVAAEHPQLVGGAACGFVVTGFIPGPPTRLLLEVELADGSREERDIAERAESLPAKGRKGRQLAWVLRAVWRRLRHGDLAGIVRRATSQRYAGPSVDDMTIVPRLLPALKACRGVCVMFDHNMGGGANQYRRLMIAERLAKGQAVLLCTYNLPALEYRLHLMRPGEEEQAFSASSFLVLEALLEEAPVDEMFVNSPVSFDEPLVLAEWLARTRADFPGIRLTVTAHDYYCVCPSFVLLDADGRYCGIPEISKCHGCLKRHPASYVALTPPSDMGAWRALWGRCLAAADEVRCFSESTREHLLRAYPALDRGRITVVPHKVDFQPARLPQVARGGPLVIGVVGEISAQKGALVLSEMLDRIDRELPEVRLVVIGTLDVAHKSPRLTVTGRYRREDLVGLVESHGINMLFFPSIWPETFSYVVAEMMQLGLPIVAFDLGAPAERLRAYPNARLCREVSAQAALAMLLDFHRSLAEGEARVA